MPVAKLYEGAATHPTPGEAVHIAEDAERGFLDGTYDEVYLAYNHFVNPLSQKPVMKKLLPIEPHDPGCRDGGIHENYLLEPAQQELLGTLLPKSSSFEIYYALLENAAGENGARMTAMDSATRNANNMIKTVHPAAQPGASGLDHQGTDRNCFGGGSLEGLASS
jgi:F-type H+-transporting ATPase subunit gamma